MSIKRTGGRKPTMGNWRASIWPRANMQYVNVVISMGICIWMHARYTGASLPGDTRALATCALGLTPVRYPRCDALHTFIVSSVLRRSSISVNIAPTPLGRIGAARICECIFHLRPDWTRFRLVCTRFPNWSRIKGKIIKIKKKKWILPKNLLPKLLKNRRITLEIWLVSRRLDWEKFLFIYLFFYLRWRTSYPQE